MRPVSLGTFPKVPGFKNWATRMTPAMQMKGTEEHGGCVCVCVRFLGKRLGRLYGEK